MLDIRLIEQNEDLIKEASRKKQLSFDLSELLKINKERVQIQKRKEEGDEEG
jgi:seryl-tRNA synthetase